tara:strand:+ start:3394 stop:3570 length:177 start_codon:yes stop_codon:yes gene_type:complete
MPNRFYVYHHDINEISKYESNEAFILFLQDSADSECQSYATSMKNLRKIVLERLGIEI